MSKSYNGKKKLISLAAAALIAGNISLAATVNDSDTFDASAWESDTNITVVNSTGGSVDIDIIQTNNPNDTLVLNAGTNNAAILDWTKLSVDVDKILNFDGTNSVYLNKVTGSEVSNILGTIGGSTSATVIIVNPNGIVLGNGANIEINDIAFTTDDVIEYNGTIINNNASNIGPDLDLYDVNISADASNIVVENGASITSTGDVVFQNSNGTIEINSSIENATNIMIGGDSGANFVLDENGSLAPSTSIDIDMDGNVTLNGDISTATDGEIYISANGDIITNDSKISTNSLELDASGNVNVNTSVDNLQVDNANNLSVSNDKALNVISVGVNNNVSITAVGDITADSSIVATNVELNATGNNIGASGNEVEVDSDNLTLTAGNVYIKSSSDVNLTKANVATTLYIDAAGNVTQDQTNIVSASTLEVKAENIDLENLDANTIVITADNAVINNQNAVTGDSEFNVGGTLVLNANGTIGASDNYVDLNASTINIVSNGNDIYFNLTGDTRTGSIDSGAGDLVITGNGYNLGNGGENNIHINTNSITIEGANNVALYDDADAELKDINVTGNFEYTKDGDLLLENNITAANITLEANSVTQIANNLAATSDVTIQAFNNVDLTSVNAETLTVDSIDGNVTLSGVNVNEAYLNAGDVVSGTLTLNDNGVLGVNAINADVTVDGASDFNLGYSDVADTFKITTAANVTTIDRIDNNAIVRADTLEINNTAAREGFIYLDTQIENLIITNIDTATINNHSLNLPMDLNVNSTDSKLNEINATADILSFETLNNDITLKGTINEVNLTNVNGAVNLSNTKDLIVYADNKDLEISGGNVEGDVTFERGINDINVTNTFTADNFILNTDRNVSLGGAELNNSISLDDSDIENINANIAVNTTQDVNLSTVDMDDKNLSITAANIYSDAGIDVTANKLVINVNNDLDLDLNVSDINLYTKDDSFNGHNAVISNARDLYIERADVGDANLSVNAEGYDVSGDMVYANKLSVVANNLDISNAGIATADLNISNNVNINNSFNDLTLEGNYTYTGDFNISNGGNALIVTGNIIAENVNFDSLSNLDIAADVNATNAVNITNITNNVTLGSNSIDGLDLNNTEISHINAGILNVTTENNITIADVNISTNIYAFNAEGNNINIDSNLTANYATLTANVVKGSGVVKVPDITLNAADINITAETMNVTVNGGSEQMIINAPDSNYTLTLNNAVANDAYVSANDLDLRYFGGGADLNLTTDITNLNILTTDGNITINEADDINLQNIAAWTHSLTINAGGNVTKEDGYELWADVLNIKTDDNVTLLDRYNNHVIALNVIDANYVTFENNYSSPMTVDFYGTTPDANLTIHDFTVTYHEAGDANIILPDTEWFNLDANGSINVTSLKTDGVFRLSLLNVRDNNLTITAFSDVINHNNINTDVPELNGDLVEPAMDTFTLTTTGSFYSIDNTRVINANNIVIEAATINDLNTTATTASITTTTAGDNDLSFQNDVNIINFNIADNSNVTLNTKAVELNASATTGTDVNLTINAEGDVVSNDMLKVATLNIDAGDNDVTINELNLTRAVDGDSDNVFVTANNLVISKIVDTNYDHFSTRVNYISVAEANSSTLQINNDLKDLTVGDINVTNGNLYLYNGSDDGKYVVQSANNSVLSANFIRLAYMKDSNVTVYSPDIELDILDGNITVNQQFDNSIIEISPNNIDNLGTISIIAPGLDATLVNNNEGLKNQNVNIALASFGIEDYASTDANFTVTQINNANLELTNVVVQGNLTLNNEGNITTALGGAINVGGDININNVEDYVQLNLNGTHNNIILNNSAADLTLSGTDGIANIKYTNPSSAVNINLTDLSSQNLYLDVNGSANVTAVSNLTLQSIEVHDNNLTISSGGDLYVNNNVNADVLTFDVVGDMTAASEKVLNANTLNITAANIGDINNAININAPEVSLIANDVNGTINVVSSRSMNLENVIFTGTGSDKNLIVAVNGGDLNVTGIALDENTTVDLSAQNIVFDSGFVAKNVTLDANTRNLNLVGMDVTENVDVTNEGNVTVSDNITAGGDVDILANNSNVIIEANITANTISLATMENATATTDIVGSIITDGEAVLHSTSATETGLSLTAHAIGADGSDVIYHSDTNTTHPNVLVTLGNLDESSALYLESNVTVPPFEATDEDAGWIKFVKTNTGDLDFNSTLNAQEEDIINGGTLHFDAVSLNSIRYITPEQNAQDIAVLQNQVADLYDKYDELRAELGDLFDSNNTVSKYISYMIWGTDNNITATDVDAFFANPVSLTGLNTALNDEITRATGVENELNASINAEVARATNAEANITARLTADENATAANFLAVNNRIDDVNSSLVAEITRATSAENNLSDAITAEVERATSAESNITARIALDENLTQQAFDDVNERIDDVNESLVAEITRAQNAENNLSDAITAEVERATGAEANITARIALDENLTQQAFDDVDARITDLNTTLTNRIAANEEEFNETVAHFETVTSELNTTLQYNVARVNALADYTIDGETVTQADYEQNASVFSDPNLVIKLKDVIDATNAKANDEALGSVQEDVDTLEEEQETGSLFVDFFKKLFGGS